MKGASPSRARRAVAAIGIQVPRREVQSLDFPRFLRQISTSSSKLLEFHWARLVEVAVPANAIVKTLDVVEHV